MNQAQLQAIINAMLMMENEKQRIELLMHKHKDDSHLSVFFGMQAELLERDFESLRTLLGEDKWLKERNLS